jgi:hypothetical protein
MTFLIIQLSLAQINSISMDSFTVAKMIAMSEQEMHIHFWMENFVARPRRRWEYSIKMYCHVRGAYSRSFDC